MAEVSELNIYFKRLLQMFVDTFQSCKDKKIVLYGIGAFSATVIERLPDFNIIGLMDRDPENIGKVLYGVPILSKDQAEKEADLIIINTEAAYWQTIYKRICDIKTDVYYRDGQKAYLDKEADYDSSLKYWKYSKQDLIRRIEQKKVISFDIFDTLITRKIYLPADTFQLVELHLHYDWHLKINFTEIRTKALHTTGIHDPNYDEIYQQFHQLSGLDEQTVEKIKELEFEIEKQLIIPRDDMVEIFNYAKQRKKQIILISDMYYSSKQLKELLDAVGIIGYDKAFISCEYRKTKQSGELYDEVFKEYDHTSLLHIGDNWQSDCASILGKEADAFYIMSGRDLLSHCSIKDIIPQICTVMDSLVIGTVIAHIFNSPFALSETKGKLYYKDAENIGWGVFAPLIWGFTHWLWKSSTQDHVEKILFFSRDGYFLKGYFEQLQEYCRSNTQIDSEYFLISRRLAAVSAIQDEESFLEVAKLSYKGTFSEYMERRWNIQVERENEWYDKEINTSIHFEELFSHMKPYHKELTQNILNDKKNYTTYCRKHTVGKNIAIVDTWYYGNCQWYLSQILKRKIKGYYFGVNLSDSNRNANYNILSACYNDNSNPTGHNVSCLKNSLHFESIFTAPHGMVRSCGENERFMYEQKGKNQQEFWLREEVNRGVKKFFNELMDLLGSQIIKEANFNYQFCDELYGMCIKGMQLSKEIQSRLFNENYFQSNEEFLIIE